MKFADIDSIKRSIKESEERLCSIESNIDSLKEKLDKLNDMNKLYRFNKFKEKYNIGQFEKDIKVYENKIVPFVNSNGKISIRKQRVPVYTISEAQKTLRGG